MAGYRSLLVTAGCGFLLTILLIGGLNLYVDPFHYYHLDGREIEVFSPNQRWQNPGVLRHLDYDTVILGTSLSGNFRPRSLKERYGWSTAKVSAAAGSSYTQQLTLRLAMKRGTVRRVIWELSFPKFSTGTGLQPIEPYLPQFLYAPTLETPFRYLLSIDMLSRSLARLRGEDDARPIDEINVHWDVFRERFRPEAIAEFIRRHPIRDCRPIPPALVDAVAVDTVIDTTLNQHFERFLSRWPDVEFIGWLPPWSLQRLANAREVEWERRFYFRRAVYALAARYPNFRLFDFEVMVDWIGNPQRYMDGLHFDMDTAEAMLEAFGTGAHEVAKQSPEAAMAEADAGSRAIVAAFNAFDWQGLFGCNPGHPKKDMRRPRHRPPDVAAAE
ncbi:MAG: hypothetical protein U1E14_06930 [Geminicoccaceae bacterium]